MGSVLTGSQPRVTVVERGDRSVNFWQYKHQKKKSFWQGRDPVLENLQEAASVKITYSSYAWKENLPGFVSEEKRNKTRKHLFSMPLASVPNGKCTRENPNNNSNNNKNLFRKGTAPCERLLPREEQRCSRQVREASATRNWAWRISSTAAWEPGEHGRALQILQLQKQMSLLAKQSCHTRSSRFESVRMGGEKKKKEKSES